MKYNNCGGGEQIGISNFGNHEYAVDANDSSSRSLVWEINLYLHDIDNVLPLKSVLLTRTYRGDIFRIKNPSVWQIPMFSQIFPMRNMARLGEKRL
jgi:hypothetical protein